MDIHQIGGVAINMAGLRCRTSLLWEFRQKIDEIKAKRSQVAAWYQQFLENESRLIVPSQAKGCNLSWFVFVVRLREGYTISDRNKIIDLLVVVICDSVTLQDIFIECFNCGYTTEILQIVQTYYL